MKVSFIIPVYNAAPFIHRCLNSIFVLGVPEEQMEIICVDDCSTDNTVEVIEQYSQRLTNKRLAIIEEKNTLIPNSLIPNRSCITIIRHEKNKRQGGGSNTAIRYAHGDYAVFMDQDDEILPYDLLGQIAYMQKHDLELLLGRAVCDDGNGKRKYWANMPQESAIMSGPKFFCNDWINKAAFGTVWLGIYKMDLLKRTEPFVENMIYEDTDWCFKCAYNAKRIQYKPIDIYLYYNNPTSSSHNVNAQKLEWRVRLSLRVYEWAQQVIEEKESVYLAVEDFYTWNLRGLNVLLRFPITERKKFYKSFSSEEFNVFQSWSIRYWQMYLLKYPRLSQLFLSFASPVYRFARYIKHAARS